MKKYTIVINGVEHPMNVAPEREKDFFERCKQNNWSPTLVSDESGNQTNLVENDAPAGSTTSLTSASTNEINQSQSKQTNTELTSEDGSSESQESENKTDYFSTLPSKQQLDFLELDEDAAIARLLKNKNYTGIRAEKKGVMFGNAI